MRRNNPPYQKVTIPYLFLRKRNWVKLQIPRQQIREPPIGLIFFFSHQSDSPCSVGAKVTDKDQLAPTVGQQLLTDGHNTGVPGPLYRTYVVFYQLLLKVSWLPSSTSSQRQSAQPLTATFQISRRKCVFCI